jgi:hypothetical protein
MHIDHRTAVTSGIAVVVHLAFAGVLVVRRLPPPPEATTDDPIEFSLEPFAPAETIDEPVVVVAASETAPRAAAPFAIVETPSPGSPPAAPPEPSASAAPPPLILYAPGSLALAGSGERNPFLARGPAPEGSSAPASTTFQSARPAAPTSAEGKSNAENALRNGMRERDLGLGLGPEGPILTALRDAAYGSTAPERGNATFLAIVDGNGLVIDLKLVASKDGDKGWDDARARAQKTLAGVKLQLRGARGAEVQIQVYSDILMPSGAKPGSPISPGGGAPAKVHLPSNAPSLGTSDTYSTMTLATFDLADVGAKPRRVVHARVLSLRSF